MEAGEIQAILGLSTAAIFFMAAIIGVVWKFHQAIRRWFTVTLDEVITRNMLEVKNEMKIHAVETNASLALASQRLDKLEKGMERFDDRIAKLSERVARVESKMTIIPEEAPGVD